MAFALFTSRVAGDCRPTRAAVALSWTGRPDWRWREKVQRGLENAGGKAAQTGIGNAKQSGLFLRTFLGLRRNFNRNWGKTGLFTLAFAPARWSAGTGGLGRIGGNRGGAYHASGLRGLPLRRSVRLSPAPFRPPFPVCGRLARSQRFQRRAFRVGRHRFQNEAQRHRVDGASGTQTRTGGTLSQGNKVRLWELFETKWADFTKETVKIRGKDTIVEILSEDLLWGKGLYQKLRFVLVREGESRFILCSTNLSLAPVDIVRLYFLRFRVENAFRELKQQIGAFSYHFWSKSMPRLNRFSKKTDPLPLESVTSHKDRERIVKTVRATELYALISSIAMGILRILSIEFDAPTLRAQLRYQRTPAGERISEANLMCYLRQRIFAFMALHPDNSITRLIRSVQKPAESEKTSYVA